MPLNCFAGRVQPESQTVQISSSANKEITRVSLTSLTTQAATKETQAVTVTFGGNDGAYQLGMHGVYTG